MPSINRPLAGDALRLDLATEIDRTGDPDILREHGRAARTLVKDGPLRVTMIVLAPGGHIAEHAAEGPITVQPLRGTIRFTIGDTAHEVGAGQVLATSAGVRHSVASDDGAAFLLTVAMPLPPAG